MDPFIHMDFLPYENNQIDYLCRAQEAVLDNRDEHIKRSKLREYQNYFG
jgi:hypothetical protein